MKSVTFVLLLIALPYWAAGGGKPSELDFSALDIPATDRAIVETFMPDVIAEWLKAREIVPEALNQYICIVRGDAFRGDSAQPILTIYYSDGLGSGAIRIIDRSTGSANLVWQTDSASGGGWPGLRFIDLDCDSVKEMIAQSISATGNWSVMIVRRTGSTYRIISGRGEGYGLGGRLIEYRDLDGDCIKEVVVERDKDKKFDMKDKKVFRLDKGAGIYRIDTTLSRSIQK